MKSLKSVWEPVKSLWSVWESVKSSPVAWETLDRKAVQPSDYQRKQKALCLTVVQEGSAARKLTGMR